MLSSGLIDFLNVGIGRSFTLDVVTSSVNLCVPLVEAAPLTWGNLLKVPMQKLNLPVQHYQFHASNLIVDLLLHLHLVDVLLGLLPTLFGWLVVTHQPLHNVTEWTSSLSGHGFAWAAPLIIVEI